MLSDGQRQIGNHRAAGICSRTSMPLPKADRPGAPGMTDLSSPGSSSAAGSSNLPYLTEVPAQIVNAGASRAGMTAITSSATSMSGKPVKPSENSPAPKLLGKRVGRFKLLSLLGQGAMGKVFRAEDVDLQRKVALKLMTVSSK